MYAKRGKYGIKWYSKLVGTETWFSLSSTFNKRFQTSFNYCSLSTIPTFSSELSFISKKDTNMKVICCISPRKHSWPNKTWHEWWYLPFRCGELKRLLRLQGWRHWWRWCWLRWWRRRWCWVVLHKYLWEGSLWNKLVYDSSHATICPIAATSILWASAREKTSNIENIYEIRSEILCIFFIKNILGE